MRVFAERTARCLLVSAVGAWALAGGSAALAQSAGTTSPVTPAVNSVSGAKALMSAGKLIEARALLAAISTDTTASPSDRAGAAASLAQVEKLIASADVNEISLQKAEWMLKSGDFKGARNQAFAVATGSTASGPMKDRASKLLKAAEAGIGNAGQLDDPKPGQPAPIDLPDRPKLPSKPIDPYFPPQPKTEPVAPAAPTPPAAPVPAAPIADTPPPAPAPAPAPTPPADSLMQAAMKAEAQRFIAEGNMAFGEARYAAAIRSFEQALSMRAYLTGDEVSAAEQRLSEARVRMGGAGGNSLEGDVARTYDLVRQKTTAEFNAALSESEKASKAGDFERARQQAAIAGLTADRGRNYFSQAEYDAMAKKVADLNREIATAGEQAKITADAAQQAAAAERTKLLQAELAKQTREKVNTGLRRARELQKERKYGQALEVVNGVLFIDPMNPTAELIRDALMELQQFQQRDMKLRSLQEGMIWLRNENQDATRPPMGIIEYSEDWPRITMLRTGSGGFYDSPANRAAETRMSRAIPAVFEQVPLERALAYVSHNTGVPVQTDWKSLKQIGVEPATPVSLDLGEQPAKVVLQRLLAQVSKDRFNKADSALNDGILTVGSSDAVKQFTVTATYPIADMLHFAPDYTDVPVMDLESKIGRKARSTLATGDVFNGERRGTAPDKKERIRQIVSVIQQGVDAESWKENGGDIGSVTELNGLLVITNTPANHKEITALLSKLREIRQTQLSVEARFLLVDQNFFEQINFDLDVYFNSGSSMVTAAQALDPSIRPSDLFDPATGRLRRVLDSDQYAAGGSSTPTVIPPGQATRALQNTGLPRNWSPIGTTQNGDLARFLVPADSFTGQLLNQAPALGIAGQYLDDVQVDFLIKATQADQRNVTLTAPRLTFTNGQVANVVVGTQRAFVGDLEPVTGNGSVAFDPQPETLTEGVTLLIEGVASSDRRYVTMNVDATIAALIRLETFTQQGQAGGGGGGGGDGGGGSEPVIGTFQLPTLQVTRVQTTVTIPDRGTILLGGQRVTEEVELETGVPVLSKIPILNRFFTNRVQSRKDRSLLILLKPTVLIQSEEEENAFPGLLDSMNSGN